ncbi:hypothetical protein DH09_19375 [Bacillaceae bacterium JMAK1]|nr:hypothetical protein DH09_19375 [Bacillaceae bacterium JMAK1]
MEKLHGICTITITPFTEDGQVDLPSLRNLTNFYLDQGVDGLTILGIMGESNKLTEAERVQVIEETVATVQGRVPIIVGCTAPGTDVAIHYAKTAEQLGASAIMVAPPLNLRNEQAIIHHYQMINDAITIPIVVQDEPVTTNVTMSAKLLAQLERDVSNVEYIKLEEAPSPIKISQILNESDSLTILGGLGGVYFYEELERGANGTMTGFAYPDVLKEVYQTYKSGEKAKAQRLFFHYLPLIRFEAQLGMGGVTIRKEIFKMRNIIESAHVRFPSKAIDNQTLTEAKQLIEQLEREKSN